MNRRGALGLLSGLPFAAKSVAKEYAASGAPYPHGLANPVGQALAEGERRTPNVEMPEAYRMVLANAKVMEEVRAELFEQNRQVMVIDADIAVMKSWSDMAKITFQRQRNVENALAEIMDHQWDRPSRYVRVIQKHISKLMWGK